jgi:hypothetical protein
MADEVAYVQVVRLDNRKYVWESRDERHNVIQTSKQFPTEAAAHQDGADSHPHTYDGTESSERNPHTGQVETTPTAVKLGPQVRHAIVNDGEPE